MNALSPKTVIGYLLTVFVVGLAIGVTTGYTVAKRSPAQLPSEQKFEDEWLAKYKSELSLTEEQVQAIRPLLPEAVERVGGVWYRAIMTMGAIHESVDRKIEPMLNDQQRQKLVESIRKGREKRLRIARGKFDDQADQQDHIWYAAAVGDQDAILRHLRNGVDVNKQDLAFGMTPLTVAAIHGKPAAIDLLVREGANVNLRFPDGNTALHAAAFFGRSECVQRLLAHGADTRARNDDGKTPLEGMAADWETIQFIGAILQVELDKETVLAGRKAVGELLARQGNADKAAPKR